MFADQSKQQNNFEVLSQRIDDKIADRMKAILQSFDINLDVAVKNFKSMVTLKYDSSTE